MAETIQRVLPAEYLEALGKTYADQLTTQVGQPVVAPGATGIAQLTGETPEQFAQRQAQAQQFDITKQSLAGLAPQVAAQDALQTAAITQAQDATTGLGSFQPFLTKAGEAATAATGLTGAMTDAQTTAYMSPYQTSVIDTTLTEFDRQAQAQKASQAAQALGVPGAFGGGREGVLQAQYQSESDRNRAALQANLLQQGFQQAQQAAAADLAARQGLGTYQTQLGQAGQAQTQAGLDAAAAAAREAQFEPFTRLGLVGQQLAQIQPGAFPTQTVGYQSPAAPASPLSTALGVGTGIASIGSKLGLFG